MSTLIKVSVLDGYSKFIRSFGVTPEPLFQACGIDPTVLEQADGYIGFDQYIMLLELSAQQTKCSCFGLKFSQHRNIGATIGILGLMVQNCSDIRSALHEYIRFSHLHTRGISINLIEQGDYTMLSFQIISDLTETQQLIDLVIGSICNFPQVLIDEQILPRTVHISHSSLGYDKEYARIYKSKVLFDQEVNSVLYDAKILDYPIQKHNQKIQQLLTHQLELLTKNSAVDIVTTVKTLMVNSLPLGCCTIDEVAKQLCISRRTLQYRLKEKGLTFKALLEDTRKSIAIQYLQQSNIPLAQLCEALGYTEQSSFTRAFKGWFGVTPKAWQEQKKSLTIYSEGF